jgi:RHS repeat-associated protein
MPVTHYIWDEVNDTLLEERDEAGNTIAEYTHEPGQCGPLISQRRNGQTRYHHFDGQGSTRALTDESGTVTDTYTYTAFGEPVASTGTTTNPFGYKGALGYYVNAETQDVYVRARSYAPVTCRWDSLEAGPFVQPRSQYVYADNSPVLWTDPSGAMAEQAGVGRAAWIHSSSEMRRSMAGVVVPQVPWVLPSPANKCGAAGRCDNEYDTDMFCRKAQTWAAGGPSVCKVCEPRDIVRMVGNSSCCDLALNFHRGEDVNTGGNVSYCCGKKCRMLPNPDFEASLKEAFKKCRPCRIVLNACKFALYYAPMRDLASHTGCIVCGQITDAGGEFEDLTTHEFRCVDSGGNQVMGPGHIPFDAAHLGYPPSPPWKPESIPVCRNLPGWIVIA